MRDGLSLKTFTFWLFWKAAQAKFETKEIHNAHNSADKSMSSPATLSGISISFKQLRRTFYSPQSISALPGRLRRSWERTALATPSLRYLSELRKWIQISSEWSTIQTSSRVKHTHGQKLFQATRWAGKKRSLFFVFFILLTFPPAHRWKYAWWNTNTPLHHLDALLTCPFIQHTCRVCLEVLSSRLDSFPPMQQ